MKPAGDETLSSRVSEVLLLSQKIGAGCGGERGTLPDSCLHPSPLLAVPHKITATGRVSARLNGTYPLPHLGFGLSERNMGRNLMKSSP